MTGVGEAGGTSDSDGPPTGGGSGSSGATASQRETDDDSDSTSGGEETGVRTHRVHRDRGQGPQSYSEPLDPDPVSDLSGDDPYWSQYAWAQSQPAYVEAVRLRWQRTQFFL